LARRGLLLRPFVRALEGAMIDVCAAHGLAAERRESHPGCWIEPNGSVPRKIGALGIRVERGVSFHGIALNLDPDLSDFDLIDPCGMPGVASTSIAAELGRKGDLAATADVESAGATFARAFAARIGAALTGHGAARDDAARVDSARPADLVAVR
ncbi:MAG: hypothetical protein ABIZ72_04810, partial [Candidatus Limnocylindrales bacterium]